MGPNICLQEKETGKYLESLLSQLCILYQAFYTYRSLKKKKKKRKIEIYYSLKNSFFSLQGKPRPKIIWMKDGRTLDSKDVGIRNSNTDTILFIRRAELHHSGAYEVTLQIENMTDKVTITMQIIGKSLTTSQLSISYKTK